MSVSDNTRGALYMLGSMAAFTINDAFFKMLSGEMPLMQALFLRGVLTTAALGAVAAAAGTFSYSYPRRDRKLVALRNLAEVGAAYFFLTALFNMPLANLSAILQALPLTVALGGFLAFREPLGWRRFGAIAAGFAGVMLIVRPGAEGFTAHSWHALAAVACVTVRDLATRRMSSAVPSTRVAFMNALAVMLFGLAGVPFTGWVAPEPAHLGALAGAAGFIVCGYLCGVQAMRSGDVAFIAPFRYTSLVWALVLGFAFFGDWPDSATLAGAAIVVATGLFTLYRERRAAR